MAVGALHDAFGDGNVEPMFYNGFRAGQDVVGPIDYDTATGKMIEGSDREHVGALRLGVNNMAEKVSWVRRLRKRGVGIIVLTSFCFFAFPIRSSFLHFLSSPPPFQPIQGRAVLIDLHAHYGTKRVWIGYKEIKEVMEKDGVVVEEGDIVCLHTGFAKMIRDASDAPDHEMMEVC